jgi:multiple sugar transport system substrate-binding protein
MQHVFNRRVFLRQSAAGVAAVALTACGATNQSGVATSASVSASATSGTASTAVASSAALPTSTAPTAVTSAAAAAGAVQRPLPVAAATSQAPTTTGEVVIRWWDQFLPIAPLNKTIWANYTKAHPGVRVAYTEYNPPDEGKALQLAYQSKQAPDVHTLAGVSLPVSQLLKDNWFAPIDPYVDQAWKSRFPAGSLLEGLSVFGGKVYSFPIFSFRQHTTLNWYNKQLLSDAGIDPATGLKTWDDFRKTAAAITKKGNGKVYGWIADLNFVDRLGVHVTDLAQSAGAAGQIDWKTGQYAYTSDPFARAIDFLLSMQKDGSLYPASSSLDARNARARWASGVGGLFFDGPWNIGVVKTSLAEFTDKVGVAQIPVADARTPTYLHNGPTGGVFWISSESAHPDVAAGLLQAFNTQEYYVGLAGQMDQPPLDLTAVDKANVEPTYKEAMKLFQAVVRLAPEPLVKNSNVSAVLAEMKAIHPNLGEITQGVFSGQVKDVKAALKTYNDALSAERDRAIRVVTAKGTKVSVDDWAFPNWKPDQDYAQESYQ